MELIKAGNDHWGDTGEDLTTLYQYDEDKIKELLIGHSITKIEKDHLLLDNGTLLKLEGNEGGCVCGGGDYYLEELNDVDNIITNVEFEHTEEDYHEIYRIFVLANNEKINLATFEGSDGSGYYGTGYHIYVKHNTSDGSGLR